MAHEESQGLVTASTDSPRQGMEVNQVQHPAREFNQDQKETVPETGLETSVPREFKPAQETEPKTGLEISFSVQLLLPAAWPEGLPSRKAPLQYHSGKD